MAQVQKYTFYCPCLTSPAAQENGAELLLISVCYNWEELSCSVAPHDVSERMDKIV